MKFFINDKPLKVVASDNKIKLKKIDNIFDSRSDIVPDKLSGRVLFRHPKLSQVETLVRLMHNQKLYKLDSLELLVHDEKEVEKLIKDQFAFIHAAGGLVQKGDKYLMIHRWGVWDLPKGKFDKGETAQHCAIREVQEECNISVEIEQKLCSMWHSYTTRGGRNMLKKTDWYIMNCLDDSQMMPQHEEDIDMIKWMSAAEVQEALKESYNSIRWVFKKYKKIKETY